MKAYEVTESGTVYNGIPYPVPPDKKRGRFMLGYCTNAECNGLKLVLWHPPEDKYEIDWEGTAANVIVCGPPVVLAVMNNASTVTVRGASGATYVLYGALDVAKV